MNRAPSANSTANRTSEQVLGNKTDTAATTVGTTTSIAAYIKGLLNQVAALITREDVVTVTGEMDLDISEAVYTGFITALTIAPATGAPLLDCVLDLDLNKTTTGAHAVGTAADTLDIAVVSKIDGTNLRRITGATQVTISDTPSASDNGVRLNIGPVGDTETVQVQCKVSAERADVEIPYALTYRASAAPTVTPVAAV